MACFTRKEAKDLWDYAKETYLKQPGPNGYPDFKELTNKLSDDIFKATNGATRIVPEDIAKLIATPKTIRTARSNLLMADTNRNSALRQARDFVAGQEKTPLSKFAHTAYQAPYAAKVIGHGGALHMTHAWPYLFDPVMWKNFGSTWLDAWKAMKPSNARAISEGIMLDPKFDQQVRSGLAIDPRRTYDDVQARAGFWGKLGQMTSNSFLGLKELRQAQWNRLWDAVPDHLKTREMEDLISLQTNHMTGAPGPKGSQGLEKLKAIRGVMFAPSLDIARVMRPVDFLKSAGIELQGQANKIPGAGDSLRKAWGQASPEQQWIARQNLKQWGRIAGVFSAMLYANHLVLKNMFGGKEDVNVSDPFKGDWMAPKGPNGMVWQATGGQIPMARAVTRAALNPSGAGDAIGNYLIGKLHPAISLAKGIATGKTFGGQPIPGTEKAPATVGNVAEYLTAELGPIATEEGIHEFAKQMSDQTGVDKGWHEKFLRAVVKAGLVTIPSAAGTHLYEPLSKKSTIKPPVTQ